uniref:Uncharacterized protein n=1 Tax=Timema shepardi TaxID=629360 RepID=A0A7R9B9Q9_TIMSH|nr:unnamed protein product [Timema shepardi]
MNDKHSCLLPERMYQGEKVPYRESTSWTHGSVDRHANASQTGATDLKAATFDNTHSYGCSFCIANGRVVKDKYHRQVITIFKNKLRKIKDSNNYVRKSVLLKSIMRRLQKEVEEAKLQKQQAPSNPWCYTPPGFTRNTPCEDGGVLSPLSVTHAGSSETSVLNDTPTFALTLDNKGLLKNDSSKKCSFDEVEDCDVRDVLQQFYMPQTLCMLDEDNALL